MSGVSLQIVLVTDGEAFTGDSPESQALGGSETALVQVARALARRGHGVTVFCRCPRPGEYAGVTYRDRSGLVKAACAERWDVLVVSRFAAALDLPLQAGLKVLWNHDILDRPRELAARLDSADLLLVLSRFHAENFAQRLPACAPKLVETRNGLDLELIARSAQGAERDPDLVTYVSRPERGLELLLEHIWPRLRERRPGLRLAVCGYDVGDTDIHPRLAERYARIDRLLKDSPGVRRLGGLAKADYYRHLASCAALLYPCTFPEISCLSALEAQALATPLVTSDAFALSQTVAQPGFLVGGEPGGPEYLEAFVQRAQELLADPARAGSLAAQAREAVWAAHDWELIAAEWEELFAERLGRRARNQAPAVAASLVLAGDRAAAGQLLGRGLEAPAEGPAPPDPDEEGLLAALAGCARPLAQGWEGGAACGVVAADRGRTAAELARRLSSLRVESLAEPEPGQKLSLLVIRDRLEREADPAAFLARAMAACAPGGWLLLCVASGAWPLLSPGYLGRAWDLGREDLAALLPGRRAELTYLPRGLVGSGAARYPAGRWLALAPAAGPPPAPLETAPRLRRARPAPPEVLEEVRRAGLV
jgi:glycosyltransferase involved in cell wall biosynthesis